MALIDRDIYGLVEDRIRHRSENIEKAKVQLDEARARAHTVSAAPMDPNGGSRSSGSGDKIERAAISVVEAEKSLDRALRWDDCVRRLERIYGPNTPEGRVGSWIYSRGLTQADCCRIMKRDRKSIRRLQDAWIYNALLLAVEEGLVSLKSGEL